MLDGKSWLTEVSKVIGGKVSFVSDDAVTLLSDCRVGERKRVRQESALR